MKSAKSASQDNTKPGLLVPKQVSDRMEELADEVYSHFQGMRLLLLTPEQRLELCYLLMEVPDYNRTFIKLE